MNSMRSKMPYQHRTRSASFQGSEHMHSSESVTAIERFESIPNMEKTGTSTNIEKASLEHRDLKCEDISDAPINTERSTTTDQNTDGDTYPEGGVQAYLCVFGSFCGCILALGMMNTMGTFQAYFTTHQLAGQAESKIGWISGLHTFMCFFCGMQIGPVFDAKGPRWLIATGSVLMLLTYLLLGICEVYWHFILVFSLMGGLGASLVFVPCIAAIGHWFWIKRGQWTGFAIVGGSLGGIIYPLCLQALLPRIGWAWSTRVLALINLIFAICANLFVRSRLPVKKATMSTILPDPRVFKEPAFALTTVAVFFVEWGLFIPLGYLTSYALSVGISSSLAYQLLAIFNAGSCLGRYLAGHMADILGRFNAMVITGIVCSVSVFALWLPAHNKTGLVISYAVLFGFGSGSALGVAPVCVGQLCRTENYGRYYTTCYTAVSFATLTGFPIAGALIGACHGSYTGVIVFTGASYVASTILFVLAKAVKTGWKMTAKY